ncbi:adenosylcobinamide-GDP ribazoletransferase [Rhizobium sp. CFBP 8762]|uniref:adenosylcobinamide-GDP ribazoletransferase n=1 Tax=Rhizobium sp. CFBP 8762 TaxID=2775279 RepID=UPI00177B7FD4|nr:adenosylcobinamide-GDP ribazoletransferase [Rhizobium sp. CFBP 8762]MBD8555858.1 adenosylcobinamide-GDP ribazoletransferase [Rhizobium sp. CFBP 8762]
MAFLEFRHDVARSVGFLSRLAVPPHHFYGFDGRLSRAVRAFPVAGLVISAIPAVMVAVLHALAISPLLIATLAVGLLIWLTGGLHEDGLADTADGFGGGKTRDRVLDIMKDSRIGAYGTLALILSFALRVAALSAVLDAVGALAAGAIVLLAAAISRAAMVWHWAQLPSARDQGVAASSGLPLNASVRFALISTFAGFAVASAFFLPLSAFLLVPLMVILATAIFNGKARRTIGGFTGDTLGTTQQLAEIACLIALALTV